MLTDPEKVALERLEEERARRIAAKVEAGEAVRVPLLATATQNLDDRVAGKLAELQAAGERRQPIFSTLVVNTGVPRGEPISAAKVEADPLVRTRYEKPEPLPVRPARAVPDMTQAKTIMATIAPRDERDCGIVFFGSYKVEGGQVHVSDQDGRSLGSLPVGPDDDVEVVARRLLREKTAAKSDFFGRINYRKTFVV